MRADRDRQQKSSWLGLVWWRLLVTIKPPSLMVNILSDWYRSTVTCHHTSSFCCVFEKSSWWGAGGGNGVHSDPATCEFSPLIRRQTLIDCFGFSFTSQGYNVYRFQSQLCYFKVKRFYPINPPKPPSPPPSAPLPYPTSNHTRVKIHMTAEIAGQMPLSHTD